MLLKGTTKKMLIWIMFLIYIILGIYMLWRLIHWLKGISPMFEGKIVQTIVIEFYVLIASTIIFGGLLPRSRFQVALAKIGNYWLGTFIYLLMFTILADLVIYVMKRVYKKRNEKWSKNLKWYYAIGLYIMIASLTMSIYGFIHARSITLTKHEITVDKHVDSVSDLRVAVVADLHLGYNIGVEKTQQMADLINQMQPDLVIMAGDIFDNNYDALDDPEQLMDILKSIKSTYGVYATYGNHDVAETLIGGFSISSRKFAFRDPRMNEFLNKCDITILQDQTTTIADGQIQIAGRLDSEKAGDGTSNRLDVDQIVADMDANKPIFVIDHEPNELKEAAACGVDVLFGGHTHNGQFFPFTLTQKISWINPHGVVKIHQMYSVVTSGVGLYGPNMRVCSDSEVMQIDIHFQ